MSNRKEVHHSLQLIIQLQKLSAREKNSGYAMLMASVMAILIFSMLSIYLFSSRLYRSTANAMVDSGSTFYAAETRLNNRANQVRVKFDAYNNPSGIEPSGTTVAEQMANCINPAAPASAKGTLDFACTENVTNYKESALVASMSSNGGMNTTNKLEDRSDVKYRSYSFVRNIPPAGGGPVELKVMDSGDYRGLRALDYRYRVYSTAVKQAGTATGANIGAQSMLQMEFINRLIPVFQFAAFYENDLAITSSSNMTVNGPVHSNSSIFLAPGGLLTFNGKVTYTNNIYRSLPYVAGHSWVGGGQRFFVAGGGPYPTNSATCYSIVSACINVSGAWATANSALTPAEITATKTGIRRLNRLQLPPIGFLSRAGLYRTQADLQIDFDPSKVVLTAPFAVTRTYRGAATVTPDLVFTAEMINSLQKPVLMRVSSNATTPSQQLSEITRLCPKMAGGMAEPTGYADAIPTYTSLSASLKGLSLADRTKAITALQRAIAQTPVANFTYSTTKVPASGSGSDSLKSLFKAELVAIGLSDTIANEPLRNIAALNTTSLTGNGGCFMPAPMQVLTNQYNRREARNMTLLQSNIKSLTAWNRDGFYWDGANRVFTTNLLFATKTPTPVASLPTATNAKAATDGGVNANCDFDCLGLGASDTSEGGLVWHYSLINRTSAPYDYTSGDGLVRGGVSIFGFAFSGGNRLPGPLTLATDQAAYIQGDYNNNSNLAGDEDAVLDGSQFDPRTATSYPPASEKKPAAILADTINVLSNRCVNDTSNYEFNCLFFSDDAATLPIAGDATVKAIVVRAAVLAGTEADNLALGERSGGLNNYIRLLEDWTTTSGAAGRTYDKLLKYRGSFVSRGVPTEYSGTFRGGGGADSYYEIPTRDFGFDTDFNRAEGLPPLTPRVSYLQQQVFKRDYDSQNR
jgi:hypothetical protein